MSNILILTSGFPPLETYGGPAISTSNLVNSISNHEFFVVANSFEMSNKVQPDGLIKNKITDYNKNAKALYLDVDKYTDSFIISKMNSRPHLIYVNSFFNLKQLNIARKIQKQFNVPILIAPRGELEKGALWHKPVKYFIKRLYLIFFNLLCSNKDKIFFQATSIEEKDSINKLITVPTDRIISLDNIPTIQSNKLNKSVKDANKINIIFLSRIQIKKNLKYALSCLKEINKDVSVVFDIFGPIENEKYWQECVDIIESLPDNIEVKYKGQLRHDEVITKISEYHLFFLPTMSENFGHVIYEALKANTLLLISDQTPWTDINDSDSGKAFPLTSSEKFVNYINKIASISSTEIKILEDNQKKYLNKKIDIENILETYSSFFSSFDD